MISIGIGALFFSIWLIILFYGKNIGLSMLLFALPFSYFFIHILKQNNKIKNPKYKILLIPILLLSSTYLILDNLFFKTINLAVIPILYCIMILGMIGEDISIKTEMISTILNAFFKPIEYIAKGTHSFIKDIKEKLKVDIKIKNNEKTKKNIERVIIATIVTIPIVLIIIILLSTADEIFASIFRNAFDNIITVLNLANLYSLYSQISCIAIAFFYFIGLFYYICIKYEVQDRNGKSSIKVNDNFTVKMILVSLNIVYLLFCYIQIKSLFMRNTVLNYAEYARQGFFQLMIVSIINLVTILIAKKRENVGESRTNSFINCMSLIMIVLTFIIVISAGVRMYFYESTYGYTLLRLLVYCILFTESILFIPTILYITDKKVNLSKSYFVIIMVVYVCMNFANFDNIIAKRNVDRYIETGKIDLYYLEESTGADAINQICRILDVSAKEDDNIEWETRMILLDKYEALNVENMDFRDVNISKIIAKAIIEKKM